MSLSTQSITRWHNLRWDKLFSLFIFCILVDLILIFFRGLVSENENKFTQRKPSWYRDLILGKRRGSNISENSPFQPRPMPSRFGVVCERHHQSSIQVNTLTFFIFKANGPAPGAKRKKRWQNVKSGSHNCFYIEFSITDIFITRKNGKG